MSRDKKLDEIPKYNSSIRKLVIKRLSVDNNYIKELEQGIPFFNDEQLEEIENRYPTGMTIYNLIDEIHNKGWQIKESTIRSYIQKQLIPGAIRGERTNKGMISIYPKDVIRHLNFVRYILFSKRTLKSILNTLLSDNLSIDLRLLEASLDNNIGVLEDIKSNISFNWDNLFVVKEGIKVAFEQNNRKQKMYMGLLHQLERINEKLDQAYQSFLNRLEGNKI